MLHHTCGKKYRVKPNNFINGSRCIYCRESKGEKLIAKYLDSENVPYETQKKFEDLKNISPLSYDFYIPSHKLLIEYQGLQHYEPVEFFGGEEIFEKQKIHDEMKREYARDKGYLLLEIPYSIIEPEEIARVVASSLKANLKGNAEHPTPKRRVKI